MEILHQTRSFILFLFYEAFTIDYTVTCNSIHFISIVAFHSLTYIMYTIYKLVHVSTHTYPHTTSHTKQMLGIFYINNTIRFEKNIYVQLNVHTLIQVYNENIKLFGNIKGIVCI